MGTDNQTLIINNQPNIPPATTITDFEIIKLLGKGSFADVYLARRHANRQLYAIKVIQKQKVLQANELQHTNDELKILSRLNHPNLMRLHGAFQNADNLYLVLDFMQGGELFHHIQKNKCFPERTAMFFVAQIILALEELHRQKVIMRDLKPENVLLGADGYVRVTDFGLSKLQASDEAQGTTFCGTPEYLSPEQLRNQRHGLEVDFWALGVIAYELVAGVPPFYQRDQKQMFKAILRGEVRFSDRFSLQAQSFIGSCLEKDPHKRLGAGGIHELKQHPWLAKIDFDKLLQKQYDLDYKPGAELSNFDSRFTQATFNLKDVQDVDNTTVEDAQIFEGFEVDSKLGEKIVANQVKELKEDSDFQDV